MAQAYQAADVYLHAARADTFPLTVLEALACGTPVVATATGGIPEQVRSLRTSAAARDAEGLPETAPTGILTPPGDAAAATRAVEQILDDVALRERLGAAAADDARARFDLEKQCDAYHRWFEALRAVAAPHAAETRGPDDAI
jgi:glycosyltransferase involved in cell wall biosynthesis